MPELPEVERARAVIEELALGRRIAAAEDSDTYVCRPHAPGEIGGALEGRELVSANRRGKAMWCDTDGGPVLGLHLGMAGRIVVDESPDPHGWDRFTLLFEDGGRLALRDKRRLGRAVLDPDLGGVGTDAAQITREAFREIVGRGGAPIKARIMDQAVISGVGNLLADEALWRARLSPLRPACAVAEAEGDQPPRRGRAPPRAGRRAASCAAGCAPPRARRSATGACTPARSSPSAAPAPTARAAAREWCAG